MALDCANGAAYKIAPYGFSQLGADVSVIHNAPDGNNINNKCGSTCLKSFKNLLQRLEPTWVWPLTAMLTGDCCR